MTLGDIDSGTLILLDCLQKRSASQVLEDELGEEKEMLFKFPVRRFFATISTGFVLAGTMMILSPTAAQALTPFQCANFTVHIYGGSGWVNPTGPCTYGGNQVTGGYGWASMTGGYTCPTGTITGQMYLYYSDSSGWQTSPEIDFSITYTDAFSATYVPFPATMSITNGDGGGAATVSPLFWNAGSPIGCPTPYEVDVSGSFAGAVDVAPLPQPPPPPPINCPCPPQVAALTPSKGSANGGRSVRIEGVGFYGGVNAPNVSSVTFGGLAVSSFTVNSDNQITVNSTPAHAVGSVDVIVTTSLGSSQANLLDKYQYLPVPVVSSVSPNQGPGRAMITITGSGFYGGGSSDDVTGIEFCFVSGGGCWPLSSYGDWHTLSDTQISALTPDSGGYDNRTTTLTDAIVTTNSDSSAANGSDRWTYLGWPAVTSVSPDCGPAGTSVTINGSGFNAGVSRVIFSGYTITSLTVVDDTHITMTAPSSLAGGTVKVEDLYSRYSTNNSTTLFRWTGC